VVLVYKFEAASPVAVYRSLTFGDINVMLTTVDWNDELKVYNIAENNYDIDVERGWIAMGFVSVEPDYR